MGKKHLEKVPKEHRRHIKDIDATPIHHNSNVTTNTTLLPSFTYLVYLHRSARNLLFTLIFDWNMIFIHPLNFIILLTVFPAFMIGLVVIGLSLHVGYTFGLGTAFKRLSDKWGAGLSLVNWWDPRIFTDAVLPIVESAIRALDEHPYVSADSVPKTKLPSVQPKTFNIDIAEFLLFMAALVYERDDNIVHEAHEKLSAVVANPSLRTPDNYEKIYLRLRESEKYIHDQANAWGLNFTSLSELNSLGGPFAGMFWSLDHNFIVVSFKGTTPTNVEDFLVDAMFQRCDARSFLFGEVHEGFYTSLFPESSHSSARSNLASPYLTIMKGLRAKALEIREAMEKMSPPKKAPINIWVTGHSLGAGLATLFYSRLLLSPGDVGPHAVLRDAYLFGTPAVGDADFAAGFAAHSSRPYDRHNTLWRIIDDVDIITKLPPGFNDPSISRFISKNNILNYAHVGEGIRFFQDGRMPEATKKLFTSGNEAVIVERISTAPIGFALKNLIPFNNLWNDIKNGGEKGNDSNEDRSRRRVRMRKEVAEGQAFKHLPESPLIMVEKMLPTFFRNHLPARYFQAMQRARVYFEEEAQGSQKTTKKS